MGSIVLYLEDNLMNSYIAMEMLNLMGITNVEHHTTKASLTESIANNQGVHFDLILLDIMVPDGNSCELVPILKQTFHCPIIAFTACSQPSDLIEFEKVGFDNVLLKPVSFDDFESKISAVLGEKQC